MPPLGATEAAEVAELLRGVDLKHAVDAFVGYGVSVAELAKLAEDGRETFVSTLQMDLGFPAMLGNKLYKELAPEAVEKEQSVRKAEESSPVVRSAMRPGRDVRDAIDAVVHEAYESGGVFEDKSAAGNDLLLRNILLVVGQEGIYDTMLVNKALKCAESREDMLTSGGGKDADAASLTRSQGKAQLKSMLKDREDTLDFFEEVRSFMTRTGGRSRADAVKRFDIFVAYVRREGGGDRWPKMGEYIYKYFVRFDGQFKVTGAGLPYDPIDHNLLRKAERSHGFMAELQNEVESMTLHAKELRVQMAAAELMLRPPTGRGKGGKGGPGLGAKELECLICGPDGKHMVKNCTKRFMTPGTCMVCGEPKADCPDYFQCEKRWEVLNP